MEACSIPGQFRDSHVSTGLTNPDHVSLGQIIDVTLAASYLPRNRRVMASVARKIISILRNRCGNERYRILPPVLLRAYDHHNRGRDCGWDGVDMHACRAAQRRKSGQLGYRASASPEQIRGRICCCAYQVLAPRCGFTVSPQAVV